MLHNSPSSADVLNKLLLCQVCFVLFTFKQFKTAHYYFIETHLNASSDVSKICVSATLADANASYIRPIPYTKGNKHTIDFTDCTVLICTKLLHHQPAREAE